MSMSGSSAHNAYLNSCSVFDSVGNFYYLDSDNFNKVLNDQTLSSLAGTQTISTNSMQILQSILGISNSIVIDFNAAQITSAIYQEDRCLRAPGSVCSSDFECAPSKFLAEKISSLSADNSAHTAILNKYEINFWKEYDQILKGFIDFYRAFFTQVSTRNAPVPDGSYFPDQIENILLFNNCFISSAKKVRDLCVNDAKYANLIRWQPAFKQLIYRNDEGDLIVTISQNSIGNAITELLGVVVKRVPDAAAYEVAEPALIERLLEVRARLIDADLGEGIETPYWSA